MSGFRFDPERSPEDNIELFFDHLGSIDADLARLFRTHIERMIPLPDPGQARTALRTSFNRAIAEGLKEASANSVENPD